MTKDQIRFLEELGSNGHVALDVMQYDGWILRFAHGYTGRANSVSPLYPSLKPLPEKVAYCEACYAKQGQAALFRITDADRELGAFLRQRGYRVVTPTDVMVLDLPETDPAADFRDCVFDAEPRAWLPAWFAFKQLEDPVKQDLFRRMLAKVRVDTLFCSVLRDGKPAALSAVAIDQGYALLQYVVVDPALRGQGLGEKACRAILEKARDHGAHHAFLQVVQENEIALNLYRKMGFEKAYEYIYLRQPDEKPAG